MAYPKPLQAKTIANKLKKLGLDEEQINFIHKFVTAITNLYGVSPNRSMWKIYRENRQVENYPKIHRDQLYDSLAIMRREDGLSFRIYDISEIDPDDNEDPLWIAVNLDLINLYRRGKGMFYSLDALFAHMDSEIPMFLPENLLDYADHPLPDSAKKLLDFLSGLKGTEPNFYDEFWHTEQPTKFYGKKLGDVTDASWDETRELNMIKQRMFGSSTYQKRYWALQKRLKKQTAAKFITDMIILQLRITSDMELAMARASEKLYSYGVNFTEADISKLADLCMQLYSELNLWCHNGWAYGDLVENFELDEFDDFDEDFDEFPFGYDDFEF